ncbi:hypothetical protein QCA50_000524 [Cerrena zonata]|uniref:Uncharacterized protein n=1 Tax=Cerrena zonata TaxID=2478898 RepID=A0AAW0GQW4_9APHY
MPYSYALALAPTPHNPHRRTPPHLPLIAPKGHSQRQSGMEIRTGNFTMVPLK